VEQTVLPLFIKFRDFLVSIAPWLLLGLVVAGGLRGYLARSLVARADRRITNSGVVLAGLGIAAPSGFTIFMLDYRLAVLWFVVAAGLIYAGARLLAPAAEPFAGLQKAGWLPAGEDLAEAEPGTIRRQLAGVWGAVGQRFDLITFWFMGACLAAALLAFYMPYEVGHGFFGRTPWLGALLAGGIGRALPVGRGTEMPLALLLLLKGAHPGAVAALLFAAMPIPFLRADLRSGGRRRWFLAAQFALAVVVGGLVGPALL
jgi:uncharacterized membrane protein YraQ (UPF0718 family)